MKSTYLFIFLIIGLQSSKAIEARTLVMASVERNPQKKEIKFTQFLDSLFQPGTIIFSNGTTLKAELNYHFLTNSVCLINEQDEKMILGDLSQIQLIHFGRHAFVPISKVDVTEVLKIFDDNSKLLLRRIAKVKQAPDNSGAYGSSTVTSSVSKLSSAPFDGGKNVKLSTVVEREYSLYEDYMIEKDGKRYRIVNAKSFKKVFPSKWEQAKNFIKENKFNLKKPEDLFRIIEFCTEQ